MDWEEIFQNITDKLAEHGLGIIGAIIIFIVGKWVAKVIADIVEKALKKTKVDLIIIKFARSLTYVALLIFVVISALGVAGVPTAQFAIVVGAAGLAIGMAWSGSLANSASGILLVIFRPIKVGDVVEGFSDGGVFHVFPSKPTVDNSAYESTKSTDTSCLSRSSNTRINCSQNGND